MLTNNNCTISLPRNYMHADKHFTTTPNTHIYASSPDTKEKSSSWVLWSLLFIINHQTCFKWFILAQITQNLEFVSLEYVPHSQPIWVALILSSSINWYLFSFKLNFDLRTFYIHKPMTFYLFIYFKNRKVMPILYYILFYVI